LRVNADIVDASPNLREFRTRKVVIDRDARLRRTSLACRAGLRVHSRRMTTDLPFQPRPAEYKRSMDGLGGLVRVPLVGGLHAGRELYIDEPEVPEVIFTTPDREPFQWWPATLRDEMAATSLGSDPDRPPIRYALRITEDTREPSFVPESEPG
jgi:hypothetical protein